MPVTILTEPFNNLSAWTSASGSSIVAGGRTGTALQITTNGSISYLIPSVYQTEGYTADFWFKPAAVSHTHQIARFLQSATVNAVLGVDATGSLIAYSGNAASIVGQTAAGAIVAGNWYNVTWTVAKGPTGPFNYIRASLNGVQFANGSGPNVAASPPNDTFIFNNAPSGTSGNMLFDDLTLTTGPEGAATLARQSLRVLEELPPGGPTQLARQSLRVLSQSPGAGAAVVARQSLRVLLEGTVVVGPPPDVDPITGASIIWNDVVQVYKSASNVNITQVQLEVIFRYHPPPGKWGEKSRWGSGGWG